MGEGKSDYSTDYSVDHTPHHKLQSASRGNGRVKHTCLKCRLKVILRFL